jgi:hypothetical protein
VHTRASHVHALALARACVRHGWLDQLCRWPAERVDADRLDARTQWKVSECFRVVRALVHAVRGCARCHTFVMVFMLAQYDAASHCRQLRRQCAGTRTHSVLCVRSIVCHYVRVCVIAHVGCVSRSLSHAQSVSATLYIDGITSGPVTSCPGSNQRQAAQMVTYGKLQASGDAGESRERRVLTIVRSCARSRDSSTI